MNLSISALPRVFVCLLSAILPHTRKVFAGGWATLGTAIHNFLARVGALGYEEALGEVPKEFREACAKIDVSKLPACRPEQYAFEVAYRWNPSEGSARELGRGLARYYPPGRSDLEIDGTCDVVGLTEDEVIIRDWKSGWARLGSPSLNPQLLGYACAACATYKRSRASVGFIFPVGGDPRFVTASVDAMDLGAFSAEVSEVLERIRSADPTKVQPVESEHCKYCPAFQSCQAKQGLARALVAEVERTEAVAGLTVETAPAFLNWLERAEEVLATMRASVNEFSIGSPIPGPDGSVYGPHSHAVDYIDPLKAPGVLAERYGDVSAAVKAEPRFLKGDFEDLVIRPYLKLHPGSPLKREMERAMDMLTKAGARATTISYPIGWHTPKNPLEAK